MKYIYIMLNVSASMKFRASFLVKHLSDNEDSIAVCHHSLDDRMDRAVAPTIFLLTIENNELSYSTGHIIVVLGEQALIHLMVAEAHVCKLLQWWWKAGLLHCLRCD